MCQLFCFIHMLKCHMLCIAGQVTTLITMGSEFYLLKLQSSNRVRFSVYLMVTGTTTQHIMLCVFYRDSPWVHASSMIVIHCACDILFILLQVQWWLPITICPSVYLVQMLHILCYNHVHCVHFGILFVDLSVHTHV